MSVTKSTLAGGLMLVLLFSSQVVRGEQSNPFQLQSGQPLSSSVWLAGVSIESAISKAKAKYGGKVLSAKEIRSKGPLVYKIKLLLPNGRVKTVFVDGDSGEVFES